MSGGERQQRRRGQRSRCGAGVRSGPLSGRPDQGPTNRAPLERFLQRMAAAQTRGHAPLRCASGHVEACKAASVRLDAIEAGVPRAVARETRTGFRPSFLSFSLPEKPFPLFRKYSSRPLLLAMGVGFAGAVLAAACWQSDVARSLRIALTSPDQLAVSTARAPLLVEPLPPDEPLKVDPALPATVIARDADTSARASDVVEDRADRFADEIADKGDGVEVPFLAGPWNEPPVARPGIADAPRPASPSDAAKPIGPTQLAALSPGAALSLQPPAVEADPGRCSIEDQMPVQPGSHATPSSEDFGRALAAAALRQTTEFVVYTDTYRKLAYPMGDVPALFGVCTDVVIRAYRALGIDLQALVHGARIGSADTSIAHRRTFTLRRYFASRGASVPITDFAEDYLPGDIVTYDRPQNSGSRDHIAIVTDIPAPSGRPMIVHNRGWGPQLEDALFVDRITGHYRYRGRIEPILPLRAFRTARAAALRAAAETESAAHNLTAVPRSARIKAIVKRTNLVRAKKAKSLKK